ncbi:peptidylprolyl isomerase [Brevundimonas fluminis]|jgi:peptidyl-prolyl cis-trans isomerase SurA|uniref:peptidylprolyl isomerase n=1 Tax=Brevundimonas fluminis TaxID=2487274 RepID=UPI001F49DF72|nr:peptidylprolyl isomerase [Brevundimonas fluminis]
MRFATAAAMTALMAGTATAQTAPTRQDPPAQSATAAGTLQPTQVRREPRMLERAEFQIADGVVATVNDQIITGFDLRQRMLMIIAMSEVEPTPEDLPQIERQALDSLIDDRLKAQEIARYPDLKVTDQEVNQEIEAMAAELRTTGEAYLNILSQVGIQAHTVREQVRVSIGWRRLVGGRFASRARVSKAQVDQAIRQAEEAASKRQYLIGEIYIEAAQTQGGMQGAVNGAQQLIRQMIQGAPFQAVAQQFSDAPSAVRGGDAGWVVEGTVSPALQQAMDNLEVGQLSNPIVVEGGVYIIYMRDKRQGSATQLISLRQIMVELPETADAAAVTAAGQRLTALQPELTCDNMLTRATSETGLLGTDLGEGDLQSVIPQFQEAVAQAPDGAIVGPVRTPLGVHLVGVCGRRVGSAALPSRDEVESRLQRSQLAMLERRYIRDLRADALIEQK